MGSQSPPHSARPPDEGRMCRSLRTRLSLTIAAIPTEIPIQINSMYSARRRSQLSFQVYQILFREGPARLLNLQDRDSAKKPVTI